MVRKSNQSNNQPPIQTTEQPKKTKNVQPEQTFKRSFTPLTSKKDGTVRLTFAGYKHSVTKDGERPFFSLVFSCMDITRENPANISVLSAYRYNETNVLGKLLAAMGYNVGEKEEEVIDADDEFGYVVKEDLSTIYDFLDSQKGLVFKGEMTQGERNLYRIEVDTLQPLLGKDGSQQRDYASDEGLSQTEIAIDLEADGGDNE
jgi:hypothetical protein